jgi:uncharacterized protein (TIGR02444 family)
MTQAFWPWMLEVYQRDGVSPALIVLQDRDGLNVNAVLFCCWLAERHARLQGVKAAEIERLSADWSEAIVAPIRQTRRLLKTSDLITDDRRTDIRKRVQAIEIELEELHAKLLEARAAPEFNDLADEPQALAELAADNARQYFAARNIGPDAQDGILTSAEWHTIMKVLRDR